VGDLCKATVCSAGPQALACDDAKLCTSDSCAPASGCVFAPNTLPCNDGDVCTTADACKAGACAGGPPLPCDDAKPCTYDFCDPVKACLHMNVGAPCEDGSVCTTGDACQNGSCVPGKVQVCSDGNACTADACDPKAGCVFTPSAGSCSDGNACTGSDACAAGACQGTALVCNDGNPCTNDGCDVKSGCTAVANSATCDDGSVCTVGDLCAGGKCSPGKAQSCADGNVCTDDGCDPKTGCASKPNTAPCNDGSACTNADTCAAGLCAGKAIVCNDGNPCTDDSCNVATGCTANPNVATCSDSNACTTGDACSGGNCLGTLVKCDDANPCTADTCDKATGCKNTPIAVGTPCGDIGKCMTGGTCSPGSDVNPGTSCKAILAAVPGIATGSYWLDPDGAKGAGPKYKVSCEMVQQGGGWMVIDNAQAYALLTMTQFNPQQGKCVLAANEWRTWDGFDGAPGSEHLCIGVTKTNNWPTYQELRFQGFQLTGYTGGAGNSFDLGTNCYAVGYEGYFCAGPGGQQQPPNTALINLENGVKSPVYTRQVTLAAPGSDFQIRTHEEGPQLEGVIWNVGAIWLR